MRGLVLLGAAALMLDGCESAPERQAGEAMQSSPSTSSTVATGQAEAEKGRSSSPDDAAPPETFTALGTEPFWSANVVGKRLTYSTPDDQSGRTIAVSRVRDGGFSTVTGKLEGQTLRLRVGPGPCSDGMSDTVYPFTVELRLGDSPQHGCARPGGAGPSGDRP